MKTAKFERTLKRQLAGLGLEIRPDSPAARGLSRTARLGTRVVNSGRRALLAAERTIGDSVEAARAKIHEASRPNGPDAPAAQSGVRRKAAAGTRKRTLRPRSV